MLKFTLFVLFLLGVGPTVIKQNEMSITSPTIESGVQPDDLRSKEDDCVTFKFHYLILENSQYTSTVRHIEVFLDDDAFSEKNLIELFNYLSAANVEPKHLTVVVYTNWKQLPYPTDCPPRGLTNQPARPDEYDYHRATFFRREIDNTVKEFFEYNPILRTSDFKTVYLGNKKKL